MVGWHKAMQEIEEWAFPSSHFVLRRDFLSPRFTGLKIIFHPITGAALTIVRLPLPEFFRPLTGASDFAQPADRHGWPNLRASPHGEAAKNSLGLSEQRERNPWI